MKVGLVVQQLRQPVPGGIGTYIRGLIGGLKSLESGGEDAHPPATPVVTLVASKPQRVRDPLKPLGEVLKVPLGRRLTLALWEHEMLRAPEGFDIVHATSLAYPSLRTGSSATPTMFLHDVAWRTHPGLYPKRGFDFHERSLLRAIGSRSTFLVPSTDTADALIRAGVDADRLHIVAEGSDHLPLHPRVGDGEFLLTVSTREPRKNLDRLIEAYARIRMRLPHPWPLYIVGPDGWGTREGGLSVSREPVPGVEFLGPVSDERLAELFARARTFVYVPLAEGYGLPPAEAMRAGVPVVSSPVPSVTAASARLVDPLDIDDIAEGLWSVSSDDSLRADLLAGGQAQAEATTWSETAREHVRVWTQLLENR